MDNADSDFQPGRYARRVAAGFATLSALAGVVAVDHMLLTAQRGVICGLSDGGFGHCWACYAAPLLVPAAAAAWRAANSAPRPARARR